MIGEFSFVYLGNEERIMKEGFSDECQRGDTPVTRLTKR
jgi:hypothetical protein